MQSTRLFISIYNVNKILIENISKGNGNNIHKLKKTKKENFH